ncbi:hypothetical protein HBB16_04185 [Pseudonocardia sp. MCCB 268]|nr:hypothetical protein [Pseudonocardia cytotoxica]
MERACRRALTSPRWSCARASRPAISTHRHQLLSDLEQMERHEDDSHRLGQLYRLSTTRSRRAAAQRQRTCACWPTTTPTPDTGETLSVLDTVRAAMSSIDEYAKSQHRPRGVAGVVGFAANDLSRVLTELPRQRHPALRRRTRTRGQRPPPSRAASWSGSRTTASARPGAPLRRAQRPVSPGRTG